MAHNRKARLDQRRSFALGLVRRILQRVVNGDLDPHEGFAQARTIYDDESELLNDLKELLHVDPTTSSEQMTAAAGEWLVGHPPDS